MAAGYDEQRLLRETARHVAKATRETWEADVKATMRAAGQRPREMPPRPISARIASIAG
jgi:hypothetical protein